MFSDDTPSLIINDGIQGSFHSLYFEIENRPVHFFDHQPVWRMSQKGFALSGPRYIHRWGTGDLGETRDTNARILLGDPGKLQARNDCQ